MKPLHQCTAAALGLLASACVMAQTTTVDLGDGSVIRTDAAGQTSVRVNGQVLNAASGEGAVAETNIGSRSTTTRGRAGQTSVTTIDQNGATTTHITTSTPPMGAVDAKDFTNMDLSGRNFAKAKLAGRKFTNVDLSKADLQGADLRNAEFINVNLEGANLSGADLTGAKLINTDISGAITTGTILSPR